MTPERPWRLAADRYVTLIGSYGGSALNYLLGMRGSSDFQVERIGLHRISRSTHPS
jgi:hypothetical protein